MDIINLLEEWLVSKEYTINSDDDLITQTKMFILRYRRIIGIIILIILLYIVLNCDLSNENYLQKGGSSISSSLEKAAIKAAEKATKKAAKQLVKQERKEEKKEAFAALKQEKVNALQAKFDNTALGRLSLKRKAGYSKKAILGKSVYNVGAWAGNKVKEYSGWLYEILFAIAISIAICMVVLPSISFFIVGIICFFLLKSKISTFKSL